MHVFKGETFSEVYRDSLKAIMEKGKANSARDKSTLELLNVGMVIENPLACFYTNKKRSSQFKYIAAELLWYYSGRNDSDFISKYATMWQAIKNPDGSINSAYGHLLFTDRPYYNRNQYEWALSSLVLDSNTRQAIIHFNNASHQYFENRDFVCTMYGNFHIRDNRLNFSIFIRSNDAIFGTPTDISFFCSLQVQMWNHLKSFYPDLELGSYTHLANSYHVYDRHYALVEQMLQHEFIPAILPTIKTDLILSNGKPTEDLLFVMNDIESPGAKKLIFQEDDDLLHWIWDLLKPVNVEINGQAEKI